MKRLITASLISLGMLLTTPVWSHHAAEGIVSEEIWNAVDAILQTTPHGALDFTAIQDSMAVTTDLGYLALVSRVVVDTDDADEYMTYILSVVTTLNRFPSGSTTSDTADKLEVVRDDLGDGTTVISVYEPIGMGNSQEVPSESEPPQGKH